MTCRQPLPRLWLMTDERQGDALWTALRRLPKGSGVIFRHYGLPRSEREKLFRQVRQIAAARRLTLIVAASGPSRGVAGLHNPKRKHVRAITTASVHDGKELAAAEQAGADAIFVSPAFATRSHPGARPLGPVRLGLMTRNAKTKIIALGGMNGRNAKRLRSLGVYGWAAIDAWG